MRARIISCPAPNTLTPALPNGIGLSRSRHSVNRLSGSGPPLMKPKASPAGSANPPRRASPSSKNSADASSLGSLPPDWSAFLSLLIGQRVRFLIVGAHALAVQGLSRATANFAGAIERPDCYTHRMITGGCACGAVQYEVTSKATPVSFCHCSKCRRWHGHVGAYTAADRSGFHLKEQRGLRWYQLSATVRRGFCGECGSSLLWDEDGESKMSICAGTLNSPTGLTANAHIYLGSKGDYYDVPEDGLLRREELSH
jgi:hypothetical protein